MNQKIKQLALAIIVIVLSLTCTISILSWYHQTQLNGELVAQVMRIYAKNRYKREVNYSKFILKTILQNETPPDNWLSLVGPRSKSIGEESFYFFKIWLVECGSTIKDIENSYPVSAHENNSKTDVELRYSRAKPTIQFAITNDQEHNLIADLTFNLNNCLFQPDYNNDASIDLKDVKLARNEFTHKNK